MNVGIIQLNSKEDWRENLETIRQELHKLKASKANCIFLPECFLSMSNGLRPSAYLVEESGELIESISTLAKEFEVYLLGGSVAFKENSKVLNRVLNFAPDGKLINFYDKKHLFAIDFNKSEQSQKSQKSIDEADIYTPGKKTTTLEVEDFKIGINVCFDLRFSAQALAYAKEGCNLLTYASAFTVPTGRAHWHTLIRARAIETQSYVIASAQWGDHNDRISTYGHSLVVDPWGEVLIDLEEGVKSKSVSIDAKFVSEVRSKIPVNRYL